MQILCLIFVLVFCVNANGQGSIGADFEEPLPLYYDVATGNATIDLTNVFGGITAGYALSILCDEPCSAFRPENHTPFMDTFFVSSETRIIGESNFDGVPGRVYSLGDVFPIGLTQSELIETYFTPDPVRNLTTYVVFGPVGSGKQHAFQPIYSPSPFPAQNDPAIGPSTVVDQWATEAKLRYNALTGEVSLDTSGPNGGAIYSYDIELEEPLFDWSQYTPAHVVGTGSTSLRSDQIVEVSWEGIPSGNHLLGPILPPGLSESELLNTIESAYFLGEPGHDVGSFDIDVSGMAMTVEHLVPEPSGALLGLIAISYLMLNRRMRMA